MYTLTLIPINDLIYFNLTFDLIMCLMAYLFLIKSELGCYQVTNEAVIVDHNIDLSDLII